MYSSSLYICAVELRKEIVSEKKVKIIEKTEHVGITCADEIIERLDSRLRQTADVNLYHVTKFSPYFPFTLYCFYTKISSFMPVLTIGIVRDCFYLLIFYSEKFST